MNPAGSHELLAMLPPPLAPLARLALNLRWVWNHALDRVWEACNPEVWHQTRNPVLAIQNTPRSRLEELARDPTFVERVRQLERSETEHLSRPSWFQQAFELDPPPVIAYFSMEYGLTDAMPLYSGGLGVLAGDHLEDRERPRRADRRGGALLPRGLFPADARRRGRAARDLRGQLARVAAGATGGRRRRHAAARGDRAAGTRPARARLAGERRPRAALPARQRRPAQFAFRPRHHREALCRRRRGALPAGDRPRHRWLARARGAGTRGGCLPSQRGPRGTRDHGAGPHVRAVQRLRFLHGAVGHARRQRLHDAHSGGGRIRHVPGAAALQVRAQLCAAMRRPAGPADRARSRESGRSRRAVQHGLPRRTNLRARQRRQRAAWPREPQDLRAVVPALARGRGAGHARHQRGARAVVGLAVGRPPVDRSLRQGAVARRTRAAVGRRGAAQRRAALGFPRHGTSRPRRLRPAAPAAPAEPARRKRRHDGACRTRPWTPTC